MDFKKNVYITIDDAPTKDFGWKTDFLKENNIPAIFYCIGKDLEKNFDLAVEGLQKGFILGNHSFTHPHFSEISQSDAFKEIDKTDKILTEIYSKAKKPMIKTFRFPYGDNGGGEEAHLSGCPENKKEHMLAIQKYLFEKGYRQPDFKGITYPEYLNKGLLEAADAFWTYDCMEWAIWARGIPYEDILVRLDIDNKDQWLGINQIESSEIVLLHDHEQTSAIFKQLVLKLKLKNLTFLIPEFNDK